MSDTEQAKWTEAVEKAGSLLTSFNGIGKMGVSAWLQDFTERWLDIEKDALRSKYLDFKRKMGKAAVSHRE